MLHYTPPKPVNATGFPARPSDIATMKDQICADLIPHMSEFDAVVCAGDVHGVALSALAAAGTWKPLMIVCTHDHACVVSHIVMLGEIHPEMRFLYMDDMFAFGVSLAHVMEYMNRSAHANVIATYEFSTRDYRSLES